MDIDTGDRRALGARGEDYAAAFLTRAGLRIIDRNWRCRDGEIDLVAWEEPTRTIVVVEVKTRRSVAFGSPIEAVTQVKAHRLRRLAARWARDHDAHAAALRVDVIGVLVARDGSYQLEHLRDVA
ncbi:YraN family protein [Calidifontibacter sp. DB0510]|uniref:UPF0102 protein G9U51_01115 n=1 Tax=Metallococcus carri TaxID=1656884 RepID=A0A967AX83_9MICO|nr:YraN family protein [Metallococcus carri]NHN54383.1 YraN family protein [Metallococcus carri]NOP36778.1 YraN family protein [Calidifontibacter sp. DB2511S]